MFFKRLNSVDRRCDRAVPGTGTCDFRGVRVLDRFTVVLWAGKDYPTMSESESVAESIFSDDSDYNYIPVVYETTYERHFENEAKSKSSDEDVNAGLHADEPVADIEWLEEYNRKENEKRERNAKLTHRVERGVEVRTWWEVCLYAMSFMAARPPSRPRSPNTTLWFIFLHRCTCGNCSLELLQNSMVCQCCREIPRCLDSLNSDLLLKEVKEPSDRFALIDGLFGKLLRNIGWSMAGNIVKPASKKREGIAVDSDLGTLCELCFKLKQGTLSVFICCSIRRFLRSVSYREFTQLVRGQIGALRIPLPVCAYHRIRKEICESSEVFHG